ncbi:crotonase/enoyl-CoA hydratase family protein [Qipengyuania sp. DSG2-2]|uniref:crotonase/enoyl-CoA hydratase family protein n=1 Tax=Qipengyuania sp. DGS2-2 TaxID=3349631 RepID=UPI0036D42E2E
MDRLDKEFEDSIIVDNADDDAHPSTGPSTVNASALPAGMPQQLLQLNELELAYEPETQALWTYMRPKGRPSFTPPMLGDFEAWQSGVAAGFGEGKAPLQFLVLGSKAPGVFCYGGDLALFRELILDGNRDGLVEYGHRCCQILHRNIETLGLPILTVGLVQGAALGGGFEALLSFDYVIAEKSATFGLPEIMFGLFPGMGAHALLSRKLGSAQADRLIVSSDTYSAQEMYDLGLVHHLAEDGEGEEACRAFLKKSVRRHSGLVAGRRAMKVAWGLELAELYRITELWADAALELREQDLKLMARLTRAQEKVVAQV